MIDVRTSTLLRNMSGRVVLSITSRKVIITGGTDIILIILAKIFFMADLLVKIIACKFVLYALLYCYIL